MNIIVWMFCSQKTIFTGYLLHMFSDLITIDWHFDDWERKQKLYLEWIALHYSCQIYINVLQFQKDCQPGKWRNLYHFVRKKKREHHILGWALIKLANTSKNVFQEKFLDILLISFCFLYICNSLEKQIENSGVLLDCRRFF